MGLALLATPFVRMLIDIALSIGALFVFTVLRPVSEEALWHSVGYRLTFYALLPACGLLLMHDAWRRSATPELLPSHGLAPRASWSRDAQRGLALFFAIAVAYVLAYGVDRLIPRAVAGGEENAYWRNVTIPLIIMLSASAGLAEEFLFRGVLLTALAKRMPWLAAALVQGVFFAFVHSGYGTWTHVVGPLLFGLGMAWVARELGVLPAALLHAQVNVLFFTFAVAPDYVGAHGATGAVALGALVLLMIGAAAWALRATRADAYVKMWRSLKRGFVP